MSLIHQALKKLEAAPHDVRHRESLPGAGKPSSNRRGLLLAAVLMAVLVPVVALKLMGSLGGVSEVDVERQGTGGLPAAAVPAPAATTPGPAGKDHNAEGVHFFKLGNYKEAAEEFKAGISLRPEDPTLHNNLALAYLKLGDATGAEGSLGKAMELRADYPQALNNYGSVLESRGKTAKALKLFAEAARLDPSYAEPHLNTAIALEKRGRLSEAVSHYEKYVVLGGPDKLLLKEVRTKVKRLRALLISRGRRG
ncbi:MAG: tetratricopeptide repeat protein [Thermodesulfobacteriota bacterium]